MESVVIPNPASQEGLARTAKTTEWRRSDPLVRVPEGFLPRLTHAHNDAVAMGWYAPLIFLAVTVSSTFTVLYRGTIWCIDKIRERF
jgi:hypothetical protein